ncbi:YafY family protein [Opitutus sp. ER46]|uniref:helix-turn-helix transcriptional regulator n=1 Tax=Opitutus sp. ER46 TaxID=2161864 RepID=UPI000D31433F|nr:YafY family protein [Opitutus sp. ER46]PTY01080.1 YafY family transcriptional regulator [Opitutus sp. ER46]
MNRTDRLVAMVMHLQGRRVVRAEELARRFEISLRTVYRDISALAEAGVPILGEAGVGYSLVRGYNLPPVMLTADEAAALAVGAQMVRQFGDASVAEPMASAIDKLRAILPRERQEQVDRLGRQTVIRNPTCRPAAEPQTQPWLLAVQHGVAQRRVLRLRYRSSAVGEETQRDVEPLGVVFYGGAWYLVAWCRLRGDFRHFRVDRVQGLELLPETFAARPDFSLTRHLREQDKRDESESARVWFSDRAIKRARNESQATLIEERRRDDGAEYTMFTFSLEWLARWLLGFGADAEAIAPMELREQVRRQAEAIAERHSDALVAG